MRRISILSSNRNKVKEIRQMADEYGIELRWTRYSKLEIQGDDPTRIARIAALDAYSKLRIPLIVEDTGFFVSALNGFPGAYASHVEKSIGWKGILRLLGGVKNRRAYFKTSLCYVHKGNPRIFEGISRGTIAGKARGNDGFGFDPIFIPDGFSRTYAQLGHAGKSRISHRAIAFRKFAEYFTHQIR
jgi:XTP/dITP diphosphohydrolase